MSLHNYYKLLGVSEGASQKEISTAYRKIALKYHPDKQPDEKGADEYFKIVTEGYNVLSNPQQKQKYDTLLGAIATQSQKQKTNSRGENRDPEQIRNKLERLRKFKEQEAIALFKKREKQLSHKFRYPLIILAIMSGYLYIFNRWFVNEASMDYLFIISGLFVYVSATYFIANHLYIHLKALNITGKYLRYPFEKTALTLFLILLFGGPVSITALNSLKKQYHLNHYSILITPDKIDFIHNRAVYSFRANKETIYKSTSYYSEQELMHNLAYKKPVVRVSVYNPKICRLEFVNPDSPEILKL